MTDHRETCPECQRPMSQCGLVTYECAHVDCPISPYFAPGADEVEEQPHD